MRLIHFREGGSAQETQEALNYGLLENPYVALVDGELDYNSMEPQEEPEPCYLGEWSDDGEGNYTFHINNTGDTAWLGGVNIGSLADVYFNGDGPINMDVIIGFDGALDWTIVFLEPNESASPYYAFEAGSSESWDCTDVMTDDHSSSASVLVDYDGTDTFTLYQMAQDAPALSMDTINPECSE